MHYLDFERPIAELEEKIREMRLLAESTGSDLTAEIDRLEQRVQELRERIYRNLTRWQRVQLARHPDRPYTLDYIHLMSTGFVELHGDRAFADDPAIVGGLAKFNGRTVLFVGHQKGRNVKDRQHRRFGMPNPEGYRKALRLMRLAAKFGKPIITFLDTPGAYPGLEAEERGQAEAIARNLFEMSRLPVPIVVAVIGEGGSGGALGIGVGDRILMQENAWYSVIAPESCSAILWRSWDYKEQAAEALKLTAQDLFELGIVDRVVPEPLGGAHRDPQEAARLLSQAIEEALEELLPKPPEVLVEERLEKYSRMGAWIETYL
ncbi:MAG: acetyl-CoA carboxylase carboxyltransferase subunit alpha [Bacteroidetes bacterium]|nr:acetyl-CoA carboxylase carboxyltransferase subunit alpha [Rhodothermia bacterium]MCS7154811.1 acetyl-CoA carboxylase carboxyltransferase subunit alpha [Bacteroidota bacterium]MCX7907032.1 acetyl-CoA carboxylase carboxyltransferase subunit alpha [Bacteroidota bacterium]MDW8137604.1 acetyl-CoA carboxylase carboxyltransferase subunit alpha [Bacteroidota bacterium]MDW8285442.1 acetyl-CoA carboxylase carboxyltransferase subunit alpha [Bacteroidota bacterium]